MKMEAAAGDAWVKAAITHDEMVAGVLLRLKRSKVAPAATEKPVLVSLRWGVRQPRSRTLRWSGGSGRKDGVDSPSGVRASPTTPLSWSGGSGSDGSASPSAAAADVFEDARRQATCSTSAGSRSKTFSDLKCEEDALWKERRQLKKTMASLRDTYKEQTARNQTLKRIKLDLNSNRSRKPIHEILDESNSGRSTTSFNNNTSPAITLPGRDSRRNVIKPAPSDRGFFMLPDLNATPSEDDLGTF